MKKIMLILGVLAVFYFIFRKKTNREQEPANVVEPGLDTEANIDLVTNEDSGDSKEVNPNLCIDCGRCETACPVGAITVNEFVEIDHNKCTYCGACEAECPTMAIVFE